jgi:hypothetical protein|tara:strand:+ start:1110 stop:1304 length:195 start_codon:yes stop_codon:yes gene_type:complete
MTTFDEWTKGLGQQHWSMASENGTLCGRPMLGNNYAQRYEQEDKTACSVCSERMDFIKAGESHE